jgi:hypothetical protein
LLLSKLLTAVDDLDVAAAAAGSIEVLAASQSPALLQLRAFLAKGLAPKLPAAPAAALACCCCCSCCC